MEWHHVQHPAESERNQTCLRVCAAAWFSRLCRATFVMVTSDRSDKKLLFAGDRTEMPAFIIIILLRPERAYFHTINQQCLWRRCGLFSFFFFLFRRGRNRHTVAIRWKTLSVCVEALQHYSICDSRWKGDEEIHYLHVSFMSRSPPPTHQ